MKYFELYFPAFFFVPEGEASAGQDRLLDWRVSPPLLILRGSPRRELIKPRDLLGFGDTFLSIEDGVFIKTRFQLFVCVMQSFLCVCEERVK